MTTINNQSLPPPLLAASRPYSIQFGCQCVVIFSNCYSYYNFLSDSHLNLAHDLPVSQKVVHKYHTYGNVPAFLWCYAESSPLLHYTRLPPNVYSVFGWGVPRFTEAVRGLWWPRHSRPSRRITWRSSPASLGRTDVKDEFHTLKPEELGTKNSQKMTA